MKKFVFSLILISCLLVTSCIPQSTSLSEIAEIEVGSEVHEIIVENTETASVPTETPTKTPTLIPTYTQTATSTITLTPTITPTPPELALFAFSDLHLFVEPVSYVEDPCTYLLNRWGEGKSAPGTIVVPIMFHSVAKPGREVTDDTTISQDYLEFFMEKAIELGFETITTEALIGFLETNEKIPERSMLLILDDRRPGVTEDYFMPYLIENDWTLTLAWPTTDATSDTLWQRMEALAETGYLDIQSHGHDHIYIQGYTPLEEIEEEVFKPVGSFNRILASHRGLSSGLAAISMQLRSRWHRKRDSRWGLLFFQGDL